MGVVSGREREREREYFYFCELFLETTAEIVKKTQVAGVENGLVDGADWQTDRSLANVSLNIQNRPQ